MRVTANTFPDGLINQLSTLSIRQSRLQNQAATGQRIQFPEDDPSAMRRVLDFQTESGRLNQYQSNIATLQSQSSAATAILTKMKQISDRAGEIAILADGTKSSEELRTYATEISGMIKDAVHYANTQHSGDFLFGGTKNDKTPFVTTTDASDNITSVSYQGNTTLPQAEIAEGVTVSALTVGANTSGVGPQGLLSDSRSGADFFQHLIDLQKHLLAGDTKSISTQDQGKLGKDEENFLFHVGTAGSIQRRLEDAASLAKNRNQSIESLVSKETDADLAQTLVRLSETQNAYKAALQSGGTILNVSLLNYLK